MAGRTKIEMRAAVWEERKKESPKKAVLQVTAAALRYVEVAIRQRGLKTVWVSVATDLEPALVGKRRKTATEAYNQIAKEIRELGGWATKDTKLVTEPVGLSTLTFETIGAILELDRGPGKQVDRKQVLKRWKELVAEIKTLKR